MPEVPIPVGFELEFYLTPSGRQRTRLRWTETVDWAEVFRETDPDYLFTYAKRIATFAATAAGGTRASWPRLTGASARALRAEVTRKVTAADRFFDRSAAPTDGAGLIVAGVPYARAIERGAYYDSGPFSGNPWRRPKGRYLQRFERRIRRAALNDHGDVAQVLARAVTARWRKDVAAARRRAKENRRV